MKKIIALVFAVSLFAIGNIAWAADINVVMTITPAAIAPGNDGFININIENSGSSSVSARIDSLTINSPISLGYYSSDLGQIDKASSTSSLIKFTVPPSTASGFYSASMKIDICEGSICTTYTKDAIITVQSPSYIAIDSITPDTLQASAKETMKITISNGGSTTINNVRISWTDASDTIFPYGTGNTLSISAIGGHQKQVAETNIVVSPDAKQGVYPLTFTITYDDQTGTQQTTTYKVGIVVGGPTDFELNVQDSSTSSTTLAIVNTGTNDAYSMIVKIPEQRGFRSVGTSSSVIGTLNAGDYTLVSFQITPAFSRNNTGTAENLTVEISYTDSLGIRQTVQKEVRINPAGASGTAGSSTTFQGNRSSPLGSGLIYIAVGIIGIVAIVLFFKLRKRKKK